MTTSCCGILTYILTLITTKGIIMEAAKHIRETINHMFWTILFQGVIFIVLAVLIVVYPATLFVLASVGLFLIGLMLLSLAYKIRVLSDKLPNFLK